MNARKIAFDILKRVLKEDAYSAILLNSEIKKNNLDNRDASFVSNLVYGVLERKIYLEYIIKEYSSIPFSKIDFDTRLLLCLALYQIIYLDKVPDNSAVDETVKLSKKLKLFRSSGFINALLRNFLRNDKKVNEPNELFIKYSVSKEIVDLFISSYGKEKTIKILESFYGRAPIYIKVNTLKISKNELIEKLRSEGVEVVENSILDNTLEIKNTGSIENLDSFKSGLFFVEDLSSQMCCEILDAKENDILCDVCSAPGGKSMNSAIKMKNKGAIYSYDLHDNKLSLIKDNAKRLGIDIINVEKRDATDSNAKLPKCTKLLVDAPCSGLGIMRRKPEIRYNKVTNIDLFPKLQYDILCINGEECPIGCDIVYSTCSLNIKENKDLVDKFLENHPNFEPVDIELPNGIEHVLEEPNHMLTILPFSYNCDGFFISKFRKVK